MLKKYSILLFFLLAYLFTWSNWLPQALSSIEPSGFIVLLAGYGPALAAIIVTLLTTGGQGLKELFGRLAKWRVGIRWYLIALLLPAAVILVSIGLNALTGGPAPDFSNESFPFGPPDTPLALKIGMLFLIFTLGFDGLGEELGWRGFALPRLKESQSALVASVILGVLWAFWHFPFALTEGTTLNSVPLPVFVLNLVAQAIIYTWIFNNTRGSLLLPLLFHAAGNTTANLLPFLPPAASDLRIYFFSILLNCLIASAIILATGGSLHTAKKRKPKQASMTA
jgi:membrane protease YdiL (CAAX protease family)